jgi:metal-sulfur cluster biosynthetic enzyme
MFIQTEATDHPDRMKFLPGRPVLPGRLVTIDSEEQALRAPLAQRLFTVGNIASVAFGPDYVTVTKAGGDWRHIKPMVLGVMMEHFLDDGPILLEAAPEAPDGDPLSAQVREALRLVIDPELGFNILDLGLIYDVASAPDGRVRITMTTTTRGCPATSYLKQGSREAAGSVGGVRAVEVDLTYDPPWEPRMMSIEAKAHFRIRD